MTELSQTNFSQLCDQFQRQQERIEELERKLEERDAPPKTTTETAEYIGVNHSKVTMWREYGLLKGIKVGAAWKFTMSAINAFLEEYSGYDVSTEANVQIALRLKARA